MMTENNVTANQGFRQNRDQGRDANDKRESKDQFPREEKKRTENEEGPSG